MVHGTEFAVVIVFALVLTIGAVTRNLSAKAGFPYTIAMMVLGIVTGLFLPGVEELQAFMLRFHGALDGTNHFHPHTKDYLTFALGSARSISPDLIIFVFLPALIFESAFAINLHTFKKTVGAAIVFAVPALLLSTALTGGLLYGILDLMGWDWSGGEAGYTALLACMLFGALISATDPVAVVALLHELGVSRKMALLIEGESLLNDGTAIVVFGVFFELVAGESFHGFGPTLGHFVLVVLGGLSVGLLLGMIGSWWIGRVFNDPMVEITLTIILGYTAMFVAEGLLHVSGVMAIVAAGLWLGGPGRTKISPEVAHFLHHFWELLAFLANTLIFFLLGMIIGTKAGTAELGDLWVVLMLYVGIMIIRFVATHLFRPLANTVGDHISVPDVTIVTWAGLRGAVSVALVLIVANDERIPEIIRDKMLLLTAGVVFLSIALNGATMGWLLAKMGYDKPSLSEQLATLTARASVLEGVKTGLESIRDSRDLRTVSWGEVEEDVLSRHQKLREEMKTLKQEMTTLGAEERTKGYWLQVLNVEREAYWETFGQGTLSESALKTLDQEINLQIDRVTQGELSPPPSRTPPLSTLRSRLTRALSQSETLNTVYATLEFDNLALQYDLSRAECSAASKVLHVLPAIHEVNPQIASSLKETYDRYRVESKQRLEEMRLHLPEITRAIETRLAKRIALNFERDGYNQLAHRGSMNPDSALKLANKIEEKMRRLQQGENKAPLPSIAELLKQIPIFESLDEDTRAHLAKKATTMIVPAGEYLFKQNDKGDSLYVITRGAAHVLIDIDGKETLVDIFGGGDILGEMSMLTGENRSASIKAATAVMSVRIDAAHLQKLIADSPEVSSSIWDAFARRRFDNYIREIDAYRHLKHHDRVRWIQGRVHLPMDEGELQEMPGDTPYVFVITGSVRTVGGDHDHHAPCLLALGSNRTLSARQQSRVALLPSLEDAQSQATFSSTAT